MYKRFLLTILALISISTCPSHADTMSDIDALMEQSSKDNGDGNFSDAEMHGKQALQLSVSKIGGMANVTGKVARQLGEFYMNNNRYADADHYFQRALVISVGYNGALMDSDGEFQNTKRFIADSIQNPGRLAGNIDVANTLSSMANLYSRQGRYNDAERLLRRVVQIFQTSGDGGGNPLNYTANASQMLSQSRLALAQVLLKEGNTTEAEGMFKTYVETVRKEKGPSAELATALKHAAAFYKSQNRSSEADAAESESKDLENRFH